MPFRALAPRTVRWRPVEGEGLEHLTIRPYANGVRVKSAVSGSFKGRPYGASYSALIDPGWRTLSMNVETTDGQTLALASPEPGRWVNGDGSARPEFDGCIDIDLSATPFSNTLPIRRLGLGEAHGEVECRMLYVPFDTFEPFPDTQFYRALEDGRLYRFENDDRSFAADLALDEDGLVLDYPGLYNRL